MVKGMHIYCLWGGGGLNIGTFAKNIPGISKVTVKTENQLFRRRNKLHLNYFTILLFSFFCNQIRLGSIRDLCSKT